MEAAPQGDGWLHEIKFDGYRLMARIDHGHVLLTSRQGHDWSARFPALLTAFGEIHAGTALVDGEVVALDPDGVSSFRRLQEALAARRTGDLVFEAFDLIELDGEDLTDTPLERRKALLERILPKQDGTRAVRYVGHVEGRGAAIYEEVCRLGLEGIVSKRRNARYRSGRNDDWRKTKCIRQAEFVIGGYTEPSSERTGFGSLLLGAYGRSHELRYTGNVGTGFSERELRDLHAMLTALETRACPFDVVPAHSARGVHWVMPELVADVEFAEWTRDGRLRQPVFRGIREDRDPAGVEIAAQGGPEPPRTPRLVLAARQPTRAGASAARPRKLGKRDAEVAGVRLTHADRVLYPEQGLTKLDLARYYERVHESILPHVARRPLALVRCPRGSSKPCFFQRHPSEGLSEHVGRVEVGADGASGTHLYVDSLRGLLELVQLGALELHCWGCRTDGIESPDTLVLDLDPDPAVPWPEVVRGARELGAQLEELGLTPFPKLTGGKGLHLVVPLEPAAGWDDVKSFARALAKRLERSDPSRFIATMSKAKRRGRVFVDYLRNARGATAIAPYSSRAKDAAPVAVPIGWHELGPDMTPGRYTVASLPRRLSALSRDPWAGFDSARRPVTRELLEAVGAAKRR